ncbi:MAG: aromatic ring-hydroxylating dioxygenase subunit alpha, partial [Defluviicoccus sp.]|nr:aromatic ring-hydroxylating dioxygenase subunit alpha [Defluviicoccus sp.]
PLGNDMIISQWHVPIDDTHCWWYAMFTSYADTLDKRAMRDQRLKLYTLPDYRPRLNKANDYGFDASEQIRATYTGMGDDINVHDQWAVESPGPIHDRSAEHLGISDRAIIHYRRRLIAAIESVAGGAEAPMRGNGPGEAPLAVDTVAPREGWDETWRSHDAARRARSGWAAP